MPTPDHRAIVIGLAAAVVGAAVHRLGVTLRPHVERRVVLLSPIVGLAVGALAWERRRLPAACWPKRSCVSRAWLTQIG